MPEMSIGGWVFEGGFCRLDLMIEFQAQWKAMDEPYAIVGLVVTGPNPERGEVLEFASLQVDPSGVITAEFSALVSVKQPVLDFVLQEAGVTREEVDRLGRPLAEAMTDLLDFLGSRPVFIHDAELARPFLRHAGEVATGTFASPLHDMLKMALLTWPGIGSHRIRDPAKFVEAPDTGDQPIDDLKAMLAVLQEARTVAYQEEDERQASRDCPDWATVSPDSSPVD